ncbi:MAG TPA: PASTA domain-containing protein [Desulfomonilia bacterium]
MKRNIKLLLIMMIPLMVMCGCILKTTPPEGTYSLFWGQSQVFKVGGMGSYQWSVDGNPISGATGLTFTFNSTLFSLGDHQVKCTNSIPIGKTEAVWTMHVIGGAVLVPTATGCQDIMNAGLVCDAKLNCSNSVPAGQVISQTPAAGTSVPLGSTVHLSISSGECTNEVAVPAATGCADLEAAGLVCSVSQSCSNTIPAGIVISQNPPEGAMVAPGSTVSLLISTGLCTGEVEVPNATSCEDVEAAGLICSRARECSNTVPLDAVIDQSPAPGSMVMPGSTVTLTLSTGPCPLLVPNALTCADLTAAGLACNLVETCSNLNPIPGTRLGISPPVGTPTELGALVTLTLSSGPCTVVVPTAASCDDITGTGWLSCSTSTQCSDTVPAGNVISQNPVGGTVVAAGSTVQLLLSSGPCTIQLPAPANVQATDVVLTSQTDPLLNDNLNSKVTITWDAVPNAQTYNIYRADTPAGIYNLIGSVIAPITTFDDNQSETLTLPAWPDPLTSAALDTYEATARSIVNDFKGFKYYKVRACSSDPLHPNSELSAYDEGRMDYTLEEFYTIVTGVIEGIPMARMILSADPLHVGTNKYFYDNCSLTGQMHISITEDHPADMSISIENFIDSLVFGGSINCNESLGRRMIINSLVSSEEIDNNINGTLSGSMNITGNYAGKLTSMSIPVTNGVLQTGTCTVIYNGHSAAGHACSLFE